MITGVASPRLRSSRKTSMPSRCGSPRSSRTTSKTEACNALAALLPSRIQSTAKPPWRSAVCRPCAIMASSSTSSTRMARDNEPLQLLAHLTACQAQQQIVTQREDQLGGVLSMVHARSHLVGCADLSESPFAFRILIEGLCKGALIEVRPETIHEVQLGICTFPQQKVAQSFLAAGADQKVHVRRDRHRMIDIGQMLLKARTVDACLT